MRFPLLTALLFVASSLVSAQPAGSAAPRSAAAPSQRNAAQATVYIYRYKQFAGGALAPLVFYDDFELARMTNGRFLVAKFPAGKHAFRSNDNQEGIELDLKGGQDYYIRVEIAARMMKDHGRLVLVAPEQGGEEIKKLKPLDAANIDDNEHVIDASLETK
jgi:hypothetical protein